MVALRELYEGLLARLTGGPLSEVEDRVCVGRAGLPPPLIVGMLSLLLALRLGKTLFTVIDDLGKIPQSLEALLFSVYYAAVSSCTAREVRQRFGERQDVLMKRYGRCIEAALGDNYEMPALESLQALVLYIVSSP